MKKKRCVPSGFPFWLGNCRDGTEFIQENDIETTRLPVEKASQGNSVYYRRAEIGKGATMLRSDISDYVMYTVYEAVIERLNVARKQLPIEFTELVYMFLDWENYPEVHVSKKTLQFAWYADADARDIVAIRRIPQTNTVDGAQEEMDEKNATLMDHILLNWEEFMCVSRHNVLVRPK